MEATMQEILDARERRASRQHALLQQFGKPLICFTMNIPGPEKTNPLICRGFSLGISMLRAQLSGARILHFEESRSHTGCEAFFVVDMPPLELKRLTAQIEDSTPVGRLFDMDVLNSQGSKIDREVLNLPQRLCLLCEKPAKLCGRSRAHPLETLQEKTRSLLREAIDRQTAETIARLAVQSLLQEVCTTPKPGLVDRNNSGSHRDMDIFTFMSSTAALYPYFLQCATIGLQTREQGPKETFAALRFPGKLAEQAMFRATEGVNTHKGAIFTLGILCGAAGRVSQTDAQTVCRECAAMTKGITAEDLSGITLETAQTVGQRLYTQYGITGIRGQAEAGFPAVLQAGLPVLAQGLKQGLSLNDAGCAALLALITADVDTNLIARSDRQTQQETAAAVSAIISRTPYPSKETLEALDAAFIQKNLSPGGSADLLAATYFLHFLQTEGE